MTSTEAIVRIRQLQSDKSLCEALELAVDALKKSEPMTMASAEFARQKCTAVRG